MGTGACISFHVFTMFDPLADLGGPSGDDDAAASDDGIIDGAGAPAKAGQADAPKPPRPQGGGGDRQFADELHSITIHAEQRTFYIDLKESHNGKFFKVSEKSRGGRKTTIMFDADDLPKFIEAFQEMQSHV